MGLMERLWILYFFVLIARAETVPSSGPVPPLQWIRLNAQNPPPALAYAAAGFDYTNNRLVIFGGETSGGLPYGNTHLLDMSSMAWTTPDPSPPTTTKPPARSRASYGHDIIASYRNGLLVFGGQGQHGALNDVWEYTFTGQFWYNITVDGDIPSPRYGAIGGGDPPSISNSDTNLLTTFWLTGGITDSNQNPQAVNYDDVYRLQLKGTVAQNIQDATGTWTKMSSTPSRSMKPKVGQAGLSMRTSEGQARIGYYGGCDNTTTGAVSCAGQDIHVFSSEDSQWSDINSCPSARLGAVLAPNYNPLFTGQAFGDQAFLLLGLSPNTNTTDTNGLDNKGEIDVLSIAQGVWSRVLPSCDPSSTPPCPVPREGAAIVSSSRSMAGPASSTASDIIIFGGKDKDGNVLNDAWLLRAVTAQVTYSNQTDWGGLYGNGQLGSGVNANGQGVTIQYLTECSQPPPNGSSSPDGPSDDGSDPAGGGNNSSFTTTVPYTASTIHKTLSAVSVVAILVSVLMSRFSPSTENQLLSRAFASKRATVVVGIVAWAIGVAGLALSFTSTRRTNSSVSKRDDDKTKAKFLPTSHAVIGFLLFLLAYVVAPLVIIIRRKLHTRRDRSNHQRSEASLTHNHHHEEPSSREKTPTAHLRASSITPAPTDVDDDDGEPTGAGKPMRLDIRRSSAPSAFFKEQVWPARWSKIGKRERLSSHPDPPPPATNPSIEERGEVDEGEEQGFVVLNRGKHALDRRTPPSVDSRQLSSHLSLGDMNWLERRRHMNMISDLDYAMSRRPPVPHPQSPLTPPLSTQTPLDATSGSKFSKRTFPRWKVILLHFHFHMLLLALCIFTAHAIFTRSGKTSTPLGITFVILLLFFYKAIIILAFRGQPSGTPSILVTAATRLRGNEDSARLGTNSHNGAETRPLAGEQRSSPLLGLNSLQSGGASRPLMLSNYSAETSDHRPGAQDDDEDEGDRIEREMGRRDVSIVTVPKRRLFIANTDSSQ